MEVSQDPCPKKTGAITLIAMGGNVASLKGGRQETQRRALVELSTRGVEIEAVSGFYETPCFPAGAGPDFVNSVARARTDLPPEALLAQVHDVEKMFGRERLERWAQRTLDIDILAYGDQVSPDEKTLRHWMDLPPERQKKVAPEGLVLPHPRLHDRAFVLIPLADVAPDWRHPVLGKTVREMVDDLPEAEKTAIRLRS